MEIWQLATSMPYADASKLRRVAFVADAYSAMKLLRNEFRAPAEADAADHLKRNLVGVSACTVGIKVVRADRCSLKKM